MKKRLLLLGILFLVSLISADPEISEKADVSRYARLHTSITHPQSANKYSSVSSSVVQSTPGVKVSNTQNVVQTTQKPSSVSKGNGNVPYNVQEQLQPPTANAGHYIFGVNPPQDSSAQAFIPTAGPMLMQILTPQGQPTGQVQYIQFLRPVMLPIVPQTYMQAALNQGALPSISQPLAQASTQVQTAAAAVAQQYLPTTPQPPPPNTGFYPYAQQPLTAYSSPVASYYHPNIYSTNRVQMVNPPSDLSLNTDEYMPAAAEMTYKIIKPVVRS